MPSAYFVAYARLNGRLYVLVGRKSGAVPNNAGQLAFPGGRRKGGERTSEAAVREFEEETGVRYVLDARRRHFRLSRPGSDKQLPSIKTRTSNGSGHGVLFVELSFDDLDLLCREARGRVAMAARGRSGYVRDAEFQNLEIMTSRQAYATMRQEDQPSIPTRSTDWFYGALKTLQGRTQLT